MAQVDTQREFNKLIQDISDKVISSTVNRSFKGASEMINQQVPEINRAIMDLRKTTTDLKGQKDELSRAKEELRRGALSSQRGIENVSGSVKKLEEAFQSYHKSLESITIYQATRTQNKFMESEERIVKEIGRFRISSQTELDKKMNELREELEQSFAKKILLTNFCTLLTAAAALATYVYFFQ